MGFYRHIVLGVAAAMLAAGTAQLPAAAQAQAPNDQLERTTHGSWDVVCLKEQKYRCAMTQVVSTTIQNPETGEEVNREVMAISIRYMPGAKLPVAEFTMPLGILLTEGVGIFVDEKGVSRQPIRFCINTGCVSVFPFNQEMIDSFKGGTKGTVRILTLEGQVTGLPVNLSGFTAAFNQMSEAHAKAPKPQERKVVTDGQQEGPPGP